MGNQNHRGAAQVLPQGGADLGIRLGVHRRQGVVKDHHRRALHQHPGDGHPLLLTAREGHAPLAHQSIVAVGEFGDGLVHAGNGCGAAKLLGGRLRRCGGDVLADGLGEEEGLLEHQANLSAQAVPADGADIPAADGDLPLPLAQVIEPVEEMHQGALARAGAAQDAQGSAPGDGEGEILQDFLPLVAEGHMVKDDVSVAGGILGLRGVHLLGRLENIAHPVEGDAGLAHIREHPAQGSHRPGQGLVIGDESQEGAQGHLAVHGLHGTHQDDDHDLEAREEGARRPVDGEQLAKLDPQGGKPLVFFVKAVYFKLLPAKCPHHPNAGEVFLGAGGELALGLVRRLEAAGDLAVKDPGGEPHNGDKGQGDQGEPHVHGEHDAEVERDQEDRPHHLHQLIAHKAADHIHIGGTALNHIAGGVRLVPGEAQALDVAEETVADALDKALGAAP